MPERLSPQEKRARLKRLLQERALKPREAPLSFGQERIWFLDQLVPSSAAYCETVALRFIADVDPAILTRALNEIVRRHEILRTTFGAVDGRPVQRIAPELQLDVPVIDLNEVDASLRERELDRIIRAQSQRAFDLARGPLLRLTLIRVSGNEHFAVLTFHHIVGDAWSVGVLVRELFAFYLALSTDSGVPFAEPRMQYADFARWQREQLEEGKLRAQLAHLKEKLANLPTLELPPDRPRPAVQSFRGATLSFEFPEELTTALESLGREEGSTLFMTILMAFQVLLSQYVGEDDIVVGTPVAGRNRIELEELIGFFVNLVLVRVSLRGDPTLRELLRRVREACLDAYAHQDVPFERLVEELQPERSLSQEPLVQVVVAHYKDLMVAPEVPGVELEPVPVDTGTSKFDLSFYTWQAKRDHVLMGSFVYNVDLFDSNTISRMIERFLSLLNDIVRDPDRHLSGISLLEEEERRRLQETNSLTMDYPTACLHVLFEEQVERTPDSVAVVFEGRHLSYGELNRRANRLAHRLRFRGVGPETRVGLYVERSLDLVVAILGILKSGAAYVPLDPTYPDERVRFMLEESGVRLVVTDAHRGQLSAANVEQIGVDDESVELDRACDVNPPRVATAGNLAYVLYTSGSTGRPKGVAVTHSNVARLFKATEECFDFGATDNWTMFHAYGFDFSVWELWGALLYGGRVSVVPHRISRSPAAFFELLERECITVLSQTPSAFTELMKVDDGRAPLSLRWVIFGGEALEYTTLGPWFDRHGDELPRLVNMYGITETTVHVTQRPLSAKDSEDARDGVGQPLPDLRLYVMDRNGRPAAVGIPGEVYVGGAGLARGYLERPELTAERFVPDPVGNVPGERLFRTGDRARLASDGELQYLGRIDHQVKIRGFRIELGEIEAVLREHGAIRQAVAVARNEEGIGKRLVAYIVPGDDQLPSAPELRRHCASRLPDYMVPSIFQVLPALPLTPEGKVDRHGLPNPSGSTMKGRYVPPRTKIEAELARIWSEVLRVEPVGVEDNFFELGGHSFLAVQLLSRVRESIGTELPLLQLLEKPTIAELAEVLSIGPVEPRVTSRDELLDDAKLDPSITVAAERERTQAPANVLLTGSTGFLGAFLLHELLAGTRARVHCLVRAGSAEEGRKRIEGVLRSYSLWEDQEASRIVPVPGDLTLPHLGLPTARFDELASEIDAIYHSGAMVNALYPYSAHRPANVLGTQEVLRLASRIATKPVHYVSTTGVVAASEAAVPEVVREEFRLDDGRLPGDGYSQSKWVAERLVIEASLRGLPVSIYRPGRITGHSESGVSNPNDLFSRILKSCIQWGQVPQLDATVLTDIVPVDYVAKGLVYLSLREDSLRRVFHLVHPRPVAWRTLLERIAEYGYPIQHASYAEWNDQRTMSAEGTGQDLLAALDLSSVVRADGSLLSLPSFDCQSTIERLADSSIVCAPIDSKLMATYLSYWIQTGHLDPPLSISVKEGGDRSQRP